MVGSFISESMMPNRFRSVVYIGLALSLIACQPTDRSGEPGSTPSAGVDALPSDIPKIEGGGTTILPDAIKGKWQAVRLVVEDKTAQTVTEYVVPLKSRWTVPGTPLIVEVGDFLPDFTIQDSVFTSVSAEPANPAVKVRVYENDQAVFDAWLFSMYPSVHPFTHPRYGLMLKEGVAAS